jgi:hypothetical protein
MPGNSLPVPGKNSPANPLAGSRELGKLVHGYQAGVVITGYFIGHELRPSQNPNDQVML